MIMYRFLIISLKINVYEINYFWYIHASEYDIIERMQISLTSLTTLSTLSRIPRDSAARLLLGRQSCEDGAFRGIVR